MTNAQDQSSSRRQRGRSPSYPAIDLERAIIRARSIWAKDKGYPTSVLDVVSSWGYANLNGPGGLAIAALKKFGLVAEEGAKENRTIQLTDLAIRILNHPSADAQREAIREAAMLPAIHREMWERYGSDLPSDSNIVWMLERERSFTDSGAKEFIREYRDTLQFAGLFESPYPSREISHDSSIAAEPEGDTGIPWSEATPTEGPALAAGIRTSESLPIQTFPIPVALQGKPPVTISGVFPLSEVEWNQFMLVLSAMKPVLMSEQAPTAED